ncbi:hypothetical protein [Aliiroseovarius sp. YM-037]|uniref:hypothetical protein n=1 Tax=Aliiroseovarius sp. YM-037 TaxID=3341728 RepID=UPI003A7F826F
MKKLALAAALALTAVNAIAGGLKPPIAEETPPETVTIKHDANLQRGFFLPVDGDDVRVIEVSG